MRLFWAILLFATQFESCFEPLCERFRPHEEDVVVAKRLGIRDVIAVLPLDEQMIILSGIDSLPYAEDERTIWRWSEAGGLEELHSFRAKEIEYDSLTPLGEDRWWYAFRGSVESQHGVFVMSDKLELTLLVRTPGLAFYYPLKADAPRVLMVRYLLPDARMRAAEFDAAGQVVRRWTFDAPPRQGTYPDRWTAVLLPGRRIALLSSEPGYADTSPWRLILRILDDDGKVEEHVLREVKPSVTANMAVKDETFAIVMRGGNDVHYSVFDLANVAGAKWHGITAETQSRGVPQIVATKDGWFAAWTHLPQTGEWRVRAVEIPSGLMARDIAPILTERDRIFLTTRGAHAVLFFGTPELTMRELSGPLSSMELLERLCDKFAPQ